MNRVFSDTVVFYREFLWVQSWFCWLWWFVRLFLISGLEWCHLQKIWKQWMRWSTKLWLLTTLRIPRPFMPTLPALWPLSAHLTHSRLYILIPTRKFWRIRFAHHHWSWNCCCAWRSQWPARLFCQVCQKRKDQTCNQSFSGKQYLENSAGNHSATPWALKPGRSDDLSCCFGFFMRLSVAVHFLHSDSPRHLTGKFKAQSANHDQKQF